MKRTLLFVAMILIGVSCEKKEDPAPKCKFTFTTTADGAKEYTSNVSHCYVGSQGFTSGGMENSLEWNINVTFDSPKEILLGFEIIGGMLSYLSVGTPTVTKSGNTYTFSGNLEEATTAETGTISGTCSCDP